MWVELNDAEIGEIIEAIGPGTIADKLSERPHRFTGAFTLAAEAKAASLHENLEIEASGIIDRHNFGAYVMAWLWISDKETDVPLTFEDRDVSDEVRELAKRLRSFRVNEGKSEHNEIGYVGEMNGYNWHFETKGTVWMLTALDQSGGRGGWLHTEEWRPQKAANLMNVNSVFSSIVTALQRN